MPRAMVFATSGDLSVGGSPSRGTNEWFYGLLDEVFFYSRPLGAGEIAQIYNAGPWQGVAELESGSVVDAGRDTGVVECERPRPPLHASRPMTVCRRGGAGLGMEAAFRPGSGHINSPLALETSVSFTAPGHLWFPADWRRRPGPPERRGGGSVECPQMRRAKWR